MRWCLLALLPLWLGCAMCASPDDCTYGAYGGRWQRDDPVSGRVGSVFQPAGAMVLGDVSVSDLTMEDSVSGETPAEESIHFESSNGNGTDQAHRRQTGVTGSGQARVAPDSEEGTWTGVSAPANTGEELPPGIHSVLK